MTNVSDTTIIVIAVAVVLVVALLVMGRRLRRFHMRAGPIDASAPGSQGTNASIRHNKIEGSGNQVSARIGKDDDPNFLQDR